MASVAMKRMSTSADGGDGIGLMLDLSTDDQYDDSNITREQSISNGGSENTPQTSELKAQRSAFLPPSISSSPIPVSDIDDKRCSTIQSVATQLSSETRQLDIVEKEETESDETKRFEPQRDSSNVDKLEDRIRDLEEKLSTLSMLLMQQNQRQSPKSARKNIGHTSSSFPYSPQSSERESYLSSPSSPFRSLESFATMPSSNIPVLESPTPVSRRYRKNIRDLNIANGMGDNCSIPYEERRQNRQEIAENRPKLRNNLSFHILHARDSQLDLRKNEPVGSDTYRISEDDGTLINGAGINVDGDDLHVIQNQEDFDNAMRVPSLDSLPGSSRSSPILSADPAIAKVLSSESFLSNKIGEKDLRTKSNHSNGIQKAPPDENKPKKAVEEVPGVECIANTVRRLRSMSINTTTSTSGKQTDSGESKHQKKKSSIKSKWLDYLNSVQDTNYDTDKQMEEFVKVPSEVEALLCFGFWISVDCFLYTLTMLPIRFAYSVFLLLAWVYTKVTGQTSGSFQFHRHNSYHIIQVSTIYLIYAYVLKPINISILYHWIRVQSMVKLYLLVAIVEVFDRLMCSLGQDCLDSLYWNTTRRPRSSRLLVSALVVLIYTALHSFLLFVHVATLNVAMNSDDQALLSLLIGGNFAEIKSTVFKKYNKASLFKIAASDICERFKLALFLFLVLMLNASQGMDMKMLYNYLSMCGIVWCAEWLSDWLKHSFITKFNYIASGVYSEYSLLLAGDVSGFGHEGENLDNSHAVVKRLGLAQIPLVCVMAKYLKEAYKYHTYENQPAAWVIYLGTLSIFLLLLVWKISLASLIERMAKRKLEAMPEFSKNNTSVAKKKKD